MHWTYQEQETLETLLRAFFLRHQTAVIGAPTTNYGVIGGYVSYDVNASSQQTTTAYLYEQSGTGATAVYNKWNFLQGSASGVATATSAIAQTVSLSDILAKELELGFDLTNDEIVGDRVVNLTKQLPVQQKGAPSVVELASGTFAVDFDGNAEVGQLKSVVTLKTSNGQNWNPSSGAQVIGVFSSEELETSGQIKYYATVFEQTGPSSSPVYKRMDFFKAIRTNKFSGNSNNSKNSYTDRYS